MGQLGSGNGTSYPTEIDTRQLFQNKAAPLPDDDTRIDSEFANDDLDATVAIQVELGTLPSGSYADLRTRLDSTLPSSGVFTQGSVVFAGSGGVLSQDNANLFYDETNKRVGIGTASPAESLDVLGNSVGILTCGILRNGTEAPSVTPGTGVYGTGIAFWARRAVSAGGAEVQAGAIDAELVQADGGQRGDLVFKSVSGGVLQKDAMRLTYQGFLGIGTAIPASALDVLGNSAGILTCGILRNRTEAPSVTPGIGVYGTGIAFWARYAVAAGGTDVQVARIDAELVKAESFERGDLVFKTVHDAALQNDAMRISSTGWVGINTSVNTYMTNGVTILQKAGDAGEVMAYMSDDIAHGMTSLTDTRTFCNIKKLGAVTGGAFISSFAETGLDAQCMYLSATQTDNARTIKTTAGHGIVGINAALRSGTGSTDVNPDGNLVTIADNGTVRFIFDKEGSGHADVEWTTFDSEDDIGILKSIEHVMLQGTDPIRGQFGEFVRTYGKEQLQAHKLMSFYDDGPRAMMNQTRMIMLHTGALGQVGNRLTRLEDPQWLASQIKRVLGDPELRASLAALLTEGSGA